MTGDEILDAMAHIDPDLIEEADGTPTQRRIRIHRYVLIAAIVALLICLSIGAVATAKGEENPFFQWGQLLKDFLNKENDPDANPPSVYAKYGDIIITADAIEYKRQLKNLLSNDAAEKHKTDFEIINRIIIDQMLFEEAERRGLLATKEEIEAMVNGAIKAYSLPQGKEIMDPYFEGAGITFEEYLAMLRAQAPRTIARQKVIDAVGREYCEAHGIEFTKMNPPAELVAAQEAFIQKLFEENKHKIEYFIEIPEEE